MNHLPVGTRCFSSSTQFKTMLIFSGLPLRVLWTRLPSSSGTACRQCETGDAARFWEHSSDHARQRGAKPGSVPRFFLKLRAHARHGIAPIAVARGSADGPHLEHVCRSRGEAVDRHRPRVGEHAGGLPGTGSVLRADSRESHFVTPRMRNRRDFQHQFGAVAEANVEN